MPVLSSHHNGSSTYLGASRTSTSTYIFIGSAILTLLLLTISRLRKGLKPSGTLAARMQTVRLPSALPEKQQTPMSRTPNNNNRLAETFPTPPRPGNPPNEESHSAPPQSPQSPHLVKPRIPRPPPPPPPYPATTRRSIPPPSLSPLTSSSPTQQLNFSVSPTEYTSFEAMYENLPSGPELPPRRRSYTKALSNGSEVSGEIVVSSGVEGQQWRRHTRVFGGGVCQACEESERKMAA